jgi:hypothetical protein
MSQQQQIGDAEHDGIGPNTNRKSDQGNGRKAGFLV